jgi:ABC-type Fe3+-hydroxamate transport system substrate-binding protein
MSFQASLSRRALLGAAAAASLPAPALATTTRLTDAIGRQVEVPRDARRIVVTFNYEEFTAVGGREAWARAVGMSRMPWEGWRPAIFSRYGAVIPNLAAMPDVGHSDDGTFAAEKVLALRPDLMITAAWSFSSLGPAMEQISRAGIPIVVIDYNAQEREKHLASTLALGIALGQPARGQALADNYARNFDGILERVARANGAKRRVYVELGQGGPGVIGNSYRGTMWGKILTTLGAENLADGRVPGPWGPIAAEAVLAADPELIFMAGSSWVNRPQAVRTGYDVAPETTRASLAPYAARPGWSRLAALRAGELHAIEHGLCRTLFDYVAMEYIAKRLYPGAFAEADPVAAFRAYHDAWLPVAFSGTWMLPFTA